MFVKYHIFNEIFKYKVCDSYKCSDNKFIQCHAHSFYDPGLPIIQYCPSTHPPNSHESSMARIHPLPLPQLNINSNRIVTGNALKPNGNRLHVYGTSSATMSNIILHIGSGSRNITNVQSCQTGHPVVIEWKFGHFSECLAIKNFIGSF